MPKVPGIRNPRSDNTPPTIPQDLVATTLSATSIGLTWSASIDTGVGVEGYQVWKNGSPHAVTASLSYTVIGLTPGTEYTFNVSAYDSQGNMSALSEDAVATTDGSVNVAPVWQSIAQQELTIGTGYNLPLGSFVTDTDGPSPVTVTQVSGTLPTGVNYTQSTKIVSGTPTAASTPTVVFRANDGAATADISIVFNCLAPDTTAPSVPTNLQGTGISRQRIDLTWSASTDTAGASQRSSGLAGYRLYRDGQLRTTLGPSTLSYSDTGLATGTTYSYRISAYDVAGNESAQSTAVPVQTAANSDPEWVTPADIGTFDYPLTTDLTMRLLATDDDGDPITYSYDEPLPAGVTITELTNPLGALLTISAGSAEGSYSATVYPTDSTPEALDWAARSQGAGVVWAHNFEHENEVLNFLMSPEIGNDPARTWESTHHALDVAHDTTQGFAGGGCLKITVPAADVAFERSYGQVDNSVLGSPWYTALQSAFGTSNPGVPFGRGIWRRPYSPLTTSGADRTTGSGRGVSDPAANGTITRQAWTPWTNSGQTVNFKAGLYGPAVTPPSGWTREGGEFYLQYRMKVPLTRFYSDRVLPAYTGAAGSRFFTNPTTRRARQSSQKYLWLANLTSGVQAQEIVVSGYPQLRISDGAPYNTGETAFLILYTAFGPEIFRSQSGAWEVPKDVWVTYLHRMVWGMNGSASTTVEWYASVNGSAYVTLGSTTTATINYALGTPFGGNCFEPTHYNNWTDGASSAGVANARNPAYDYGAGVPISTQESYDIRYTQIIFSTQFIPEPAV